MSSEGLPDRRSLWVDQLRESARRPASESERRWLGERAGRATGLDARYRRACIVGCLASVGLAIVMLATSPIGTSATPQDVTTAGCAAAPAGFGLVCTLAELLFGFATWRRALAALTLGTFVLGIAWHVYSAERYVPGVVILSGALITLGGASAGVITLVTLRRARIDAAALAAAAEHGVVVTFTRPPERQFEEALRGDRADAEDVLPQHLEVLVPTGLLLAERGNVLSGRDPLHFVHVRSVVEDGALQPTTPFDTEGENDVMPSTRRLTVLEQAEVMQAATAALRAWATPAAVAAFVGAQVARLALRSIEVPPSIAWSAAFAPAALLLARGFLLWRSHRADAIDGTVVLVETELGRVEFFPRSTRVFSVAGIPEPWRGAAP